MELNDEMKNDFAILCRSIVWEFRTFGRATLDTFDSARRMMEKHGLELGPQVVIDGVEHKLEPPKPDLNYQPGGQWSGGPGMPYGS